MAALAELSRLWHRLVAAVGTASSSGAGPRTLPDLPESASAASSSGVEDLRLRLALMAAAPAVGAFWLPGDGDLDGAPLGPGRGLYCVTWDGG